MHADPATSAGHAGWILTAKVTLSAALGFVPFRGHVSSLQPPVPLQDATRTQTVSIFLKHSEIPPFGGILVSDYVRARARAHVLFLRRWLRAHPPL